MERAELERALREGGSPAQLRRLLAAELERSARELRLKRAGYDEPVTVAFAPGLYAAFPAGGVVAEAAEQALREAGTGQLMGGNGVFHLPGEDAELAALAFDEAVADVDRLRAAAVVVPDGVIEATDLRPVLAPAEDVTILPHADPEPSRRVARRMLLTLRGKGKWGGFHSEFTNLARGFKDEWPVAERAGEALIEAGLLLQKPSVGQRHVSLNPRRKGEIDRLIDDGELPEGLRLPQ